MGKVPDLLEEAKQTFIERGKVYGSNYYHCGKVMSALFPEGITLKTRDDFLRFLSFYMVILKAGRHAQVLTRGEFHQDTIRDMGVYSFILEEVEQWVKENSDDMPF